MVLSPRQYGTAVVLNAEISLYLNIIKTLVGFENRVFENIRWVGQKEPAYAIFRKQNYLRFVSGMPFRWF